MPKCHLLFGIVSIKIPGLVKYSLFILDLPFSGNTPPKPPEPIKTNNDPLFTNMFPETATTTKPFLSRNLGFVPDGPRLYIQGISTRLDKVC